MEITMTPIGTFFTDETDIPRHWSISDKKGRIELDPAYRQGIKDIGPGQRIVVLFYFHESRGFTPDLLIQNPPHKSRPMGVFSICSPRRPNPVGLSVVTVIDVEQNVIFIDHIDMIDGTPIIDIKPHIAD
ncbi:MAG: tRNA (N6-threonylcarbamoyladenosine(37)-N6)-methyltransferase TrmO [Thermodesulfobacteriota bacterium]